MPYKEVKDDQFEWKGGTIVHKPTGAEFAWSYPNSASKQIAFNWKEAGSVLANGDDYDQEEIMHRAVELLTEKFPRRP